LKAILLDDAFDTTGTDEEASLPQLLGDDVDRGIGIEETVADDLAFDLVGPHVVRLGAALLGLEGQGPVFFELIEHLIITLPGKAILLGSPGGAKAIAFTFRNHG
jgi:hypothetical protein